jgi:GNAT superfamily N-acetyltransferase
MIDIREAISDDVPLIARVHAKADWETYAPLFGAQAYALEVGECEERWRQALRDGAVLLVATDADTIVGFGHACGDRIGALYLLPAYHRRGIGSALLARLLQALHERGVTQVQFHVVAVNAAAIAFYSARGAPGRPLHQQGRARGHGGPGFCHRDCGGWLSVGPVIQLDECRASNAEVAGSSPAGTATDVQHQRLRLVHSRPIARRPTSVIWYSYQQPPGACSALLIATSPLPSRLRMSLV